MSIRKQVETAEVALHNAMDQVWGENGHLAFNLAFRVASPDARKAWTDATNNLVDLQEKAVKMGNASFDGSMFCWR